MIKKSTMYRQGRQWIISSWSNDYNAFILSHPMGYYEAREIVGQENQKRRIK